MNQSADFFETEIIYNNLQTPTNESWRLQLVHLEIEWTTSYGVTPPLLPPSQLPPL